jgi:hypothetical protein
MCSIVQIEMLDSPEQRSLEQLENEICELAAHLAAATCRWLLLIAEFDARGGWAEWGVTSCAHWLSWRCGIGLGAAREHVRVGRILAGLPLVRDRFGAGELSYSKVRALTRVATEATEADLVEIARHATGAQLETLCRGYGSALRATTDRALEAHQLQRLDCCWDEDGMLRVEGRLTAEDGALLMAALEAAKEEIPEDAREEGLGPPAQRAQALMSIVRGEKEAKCELVVHVDAETLSSDTVVTSSEVSGGPALAPETARRLGCDAALVRIIERDGKPLSVGRRTRTIPPALRRALRSRDGGCRFPGCTHTRHLHAHHIQHWARGGRTDLGNLVQLCTHHHQLVHEGGFRVELRRSGGLRFHRPNGIVIPEAGGGRGAQGPPLQERHREHRLAINPDTCRPLSAGDRLDYDIAVEGLCRKELNREREREREPERERPPDQPEE